MDASALKKAKSPTRGPCSNEEKWKRVRQLLEERGADGERSVAAIKELYSLASPKMLTWLGGLFDSEIGGFYYSDSARDGEEFLPDIESTCQAIVVLRKLGVLPSYELLPKEMRKGIGCFISSCEDESGFFYHSQWTKEATDRLLGRRGRDLTYAISLSNELGFELPYPTAIERLERGIALAPLKSEETFAEHLASLDKNDLRLNVHVLCSQSMQIKAAKLGGVTAEFIEEIFESGAVDLVGEKRFYNLNIFNSAITLFNSLELPFKSAYKYANAVANMLTVDLEGGIDVCENVWGSIHSAIKNLEAYGKAAEKRQAERLRAKVSSMIPEAIANTTKKLLTFLVDDGSFSYFPLGYACSKSQGMTVSRKDVREGCVNGTTCFVNAIESVLNALEIQHVCPEPLEPSELSHFISALK